MRKDPFGKAVPALNAEDLLNTLKYFTDSTQWQVINFSNVASCQMSPEKMLDLSYKVKECLEDPEINGIIITHGTDTLEETAYFLDIIFEDSRPIVLTAAQRDASEYDTDGPRNLRNAMLIAQNHGALGQGTLVTLNSEIHAARDVRKMHTSRLDAFTSGELGALGRIDGEKVFWYRQTLPIVKFGIPKHLANIAIVKVYTGMSPDIIEYFLEQSSEGLVIEAFGRGNIPPQLVPSIKKAVDNGIPVVITSRTLFGRTAPVYGYPGGGADLERAGAWFAGDLSSEKTRLLMSVTLGQKMPLPELKNILDRGSIRS